MLKIKYQKSFDRDIKRVKKRGYAFQKLKQVIGLLVNNEKLPRQYQDHALIGNYIDHRECHIEPNWLLIYRKESDTIIFVRTGTHAYLFK